MFDLWCFLKKDRRCVLSIFSAIVAFGSVVNASAADLCSFKVKQSFLHVNESGMLTRCGKSYRGVGVNYFNAFYRTLINPKDQSYVAGLQELKNRNIPFIRMMASGFWPMDYKLYQTDKERYFFLLDEFVRKAEDYEIGLIMSLFWNVATISDLVGETRNQWGNPDSKTIAFMRQYTAEVVTRYKTSSAVWAWEFGNEMNAYVDLLDQGKAGYPKVAPDKGTPVSRSVGDELTSADLREALSQFAKTVRLYDPSRLISSGNDAPRPNAYNRYINRRWNKDNWNEHLAILEIQNPVLYDSVSIHVYPDKEGIYGEGVGKGIDGLINAGMAAADRMKKPLFVGEFGVPATLEDINGRVKFQQIIFAIESAKVPLSALWVFDFPGQEEMWNVSPVNKRSYQLDEIENVNRRIRAQGKM